MTTDVETVTPDDTVEEAADQMQGTDAHSGFPVCESGRVIGYVSARDILLADEGAIMKEVMSTDLRVARPDMKVKNAARVILRSGIQKLPVVDDEGHLVGIISNADVVRSQIERTSPRKVKKLKSMLENIHEVDFEISRGSIDVTDVLPTQTEVYADELEGRKYELEEGLNEPLVAIQNGDETVLADGHHRALAAKELSIDEMDAYIIHIDEEVELGMTETARKSGLETLDDIDVIDYAPHPLMDMVDKEESDSSTMG